MNGKIWIELFIITENVRDSAQLSLEILYINIIDITGDTAIRMKLHDSNLQYKKVCFSLKLDVRQGNFVTPVNSL